MHFHGQDVRAADQQAGAEKGQINRVLARAGRPGEVGDGAGGQVWAAEDFGAVEVDDAGVVAQQPQVQASVFGGVGDEEGVPEIGGDVFVVGVGAVADDGGFVAVAVAQLGPAVGPAAVVEGRVAPGGALVGAVVQVAPEGVAGHQHAGFDAHDGDAHGGGGGGEADAVGGHRPEGVAAGLDIGPCQRIRRGGVLAEPGGALIEFDAGYAE